MGSLRNGTQVQVMKGKPTPEQMKNRVEEYKAKKERDAAKDAAKLRIAQRRHGFVSEIPEEGVLTGTFEKPVTTIPQGDGIYVREENEIGVIVVKQHDNKLKGLSSSIEEGFHLKLPKIPRNMFAQIVSFFRKICKDMRQAEAYAVIYWDKEEEEYFIDVPTHRVSKASVNYERNDKYESNGRYLTAMEIHSHNTMSGYFSGTDTADEKALRLFGVVGHVERKKPEWALRAHCPAAGKYVKLSLWDMFDCTEEAIEGLEEIPIVQYPHEEWVKNVQDVAKHAGHIKHVHGARSGGSGWEPWSSDDDDGWMQAWMGQGSYGGHRRPAGFRGSYTGHPTSQPRQYSLPLGRPGVSSAPVGGQTIQMRENRLRMIFGEQFVDEWIKYGLSKDETERVWAAGEDPDDFDDYFARKYDSHGSRGIGDFGWLMLGDDEFYEGVDELCTAMDQGDVIKFVGRLISNGYAAEIDVAVTTFEEDPEAFGLILMDEMDNEETDVYTQMFKAAMEDEDTVG